MSKEVEEYDSKGNLIHYKAPSGLETWREYDSKGNCIHYKHSDGFETWREFDLNNNLIHCKDSSGYESWKEYDSEGNLTYFKTSEGYESGTPANTVKDSGIETIYKVHGLEFNTLEEAQEFQKVANFIDKNRELVLKYLNKE